MCLPIRILQCCKRVIAFSRDMLIGKRLMANYNIYSLVYKE